MSFDEVVEKLLNLKRDEKMKGGGLDKVTQEKISSLKEKQKNKTGRKDK